MKVNSALKQSIQEFCLLVSNYLELFQNVQFSWKSALNFDNHSQFFNIKYRTILLISGSLSIFFLNLNTANAKYPNGCTGHNKHFSPFIWLQVPGGLVTAGGLPLNKGNIYIGKTSPMSLHDAYLDQFGKDFTSFSTARAAEMVSGGHLFLRLQSNNDDPLAYNYPDLLGMTMNDMVSEGLIQETALDTFNIPHFLPSNRVLFDSNFIINFFFYPCQIVF
ncbi:unnamed protein product [Coffea canephora]|uniref:DH200=94 genomic scaffold, scaffold_688 n=1 Tax=Coffea canephora TaxID=49390 RepID=A0A068VGT6_COFCA|nr:unnamed protein product [Coffea canephora]